MKTSVEIAEIAKALSVAQSKMKVIKKETENPFFKSKYADLASIMEKTQPLLAEQGLSVTQGASYAQETGWVLITRLSHVSGQFYETMYPLLAKDHSAQAMGSALSYARRYSYSALTGAVAGNDDDDGEGAQARHQPPAVTQTPAKPVIVPKKVVIPSQPGLTTTTFDDIPF